MFLTLEFTGQSADVQLIPQHNGANEKDKMALCHNCLEYKMILMVLGATC